MATVTIELREMIDNLLDYSTDLSKTTHFQKIEKVAPIIFNFDYPIFDEAYRNVLNTKILSAYYMNELGFETYGEWHFRLQEFMIRRMPYYNRLYKSVLTNDYDPFDNIGYTDKYTRNKDTKRDNFMKQHYKDNTQSDGTTHDDGVSNSDSTQHEKGNVTNNGTSKDSSTIDNTSESTLKTTEDTKTNATDVANKRTIDEDTPQSNKEVSLNHASNIAVTNSNDEKNGTATTTTDSNSNGKDKSVSESNGVTNSTSDTTNDGSVHGKIVSENDGKSHTTIDGKGDSSTNGTEKINNVEDYLFERHGRNGNQTVGKLIADQRKNIIDVDTMLISELRDLFLLVYSY